MIAFGGVAKIKNADELGEICNIDQIKIKKSECQNSVLNVTKLQTELDTLNEKFKGEIKNAYIQKPYHKEPQLYQLGLTQEIDNKTKKVTPPLQEFKKDPTCEIPDTTLHRLNYQSSIQIFSNIFRSHRLESSEAKNFKEYLDEIFFKNSSVNFNVTYEQFQSNPLIAALMKDSEAFNKAKATGFSPEIMNQITNSDSVVTKLQQDTKKDCANTYAKLNEVLCNPPNNVMPSNYKKLKDILTENTAEGDLLQYSLANQEIELFCDTQSGPNEYDEYLKVFKENVPESITKLPLLKNSVFSTYNQTIKKQYELLCSHQDKSPAEFAKTIKEKGCEDKNSLSPDCQYLKTAEILYRDKLQTPGITWEEVFQEDTKMPKVVRSYLGEKETTDGTSTKPTQTKSNVSGAQNGAKSGAFAGGVVGTGPKGNKIIRESNLTTDNGDEDSYEESFFEQEIAKEQRIANNMNNFYKNVYDRLNKTVDEKMPERSMRFTPKRKKKIRNKILTDTLNSSYASSQLYGDFDPLFDSVSTNIAGDIASNNFYDYTGDDHLEGYTEDSEADKRAREYNRALGGTKENRAIMDRATGKAGRAIASTGGSAGLGAIDPKTGKYILTPDSDMKAEIIKDTMISTEVDTLIFDTDKSFEDVISFIQGLKDGDDDLKKKLISILDSDDKDYFYIKDKERDLVVKVKKKRNGQLKILPHKPHRTKSGYKDFFVQVRDIFDSKYDSVDKLINFLNDKGSSLYKQALEN